MPLNRLTGRGKCEDHIAFKVVHPFTDRYGGYTLTYRMIPMSLKDGDKYISGPPNPQHFAIDMEDEAGQFTNRIAEAFIGGPYDTDAPRIITTKIPIIDSLMEAILGDLRHDGLANLLRTKVRQ